MVAETLPKKITAMKSVAMVLTFSHINAKMVTPLTAMVVLQLVLSNLATLAQVVTPIDQTIVDRLAVMV